MKTILLAVVVCAISLFVGCANTSNVGNNFSRYDEFKQTATDEVVISPSALLRAVSDVNGTRFYLICRISTSGKAGHYNQIIYLADGEQIILNGMSKLEDVNVSYGSATYYERSAFPVSKEQLRKMAYCSTLREKVYGENVTGVGNVVPAENHQAIKKFYELYAANK